MPAPPSTVELLPKDRLLIATGERVVFRVYADGVDVTSQSTFTVRNPLAGGVEGSTLIGGQSLSSVLEAEYNGVKSQKVPFTVITPAFESGYAINIGSYVRFDAALQLTNAERVTFRYAASVPVNARVVFWSDQAQPISDWIALSGEGDISVPIAPWEKDKSYDARAIGLEVTGDIEVDQLRVIRPFIYGVNLAWLDGGYGHDFGPSYHHPDWGVSYNAAHVDELLTMSDHMGIKLWRVWVFESCEGLIKDNGIVTDVHETFWRNFDDFIFTQLPKHDVKVYLMLFGAAHANECPDPSVLKAGSARQAFFDHAMLPFVSRYQGSPWVWGFDLVNEMEAGIAGGNGNHTSNGVTWGVARDYMSQAATQTRAVAPRRFVGGSSGWHNHQNVAAGQFSGLGFTHLDFHNYVDSGALPSYPSLQRHARVLVGEAGQQLQSVSDSVQLSATLTMVKAAAANAYWGILPWAIEHPGYTQTYGLLTQDSTYGNLKPRPALQALRDWALSRTDLGP